MQHIGKNLKLYLSCKRQSFKPRSDQPKDSYSHCLSPAKLSVCSQILLQVKASTGLFSHQGGLTQDPSAVFGVLRLKPQPAKTSQLQPKSGSRTPSRSNDTQTKPLSVTFQESKQCVAFFTTCQNKGNKHKHCYSIDRPLNNFQQKSFVVIKGVLLNVPV